MTTKSKQNVAALCIFLCMFLIAATPKNVNKADVLKDVLYSSIVWVESKGDVNAKSSDGSLGIVQIKPVMVTEVNRICRIRGIDNRYTLKDRLNPDKSKEMFWIYQEFYHPELNWDSVTLKDMESLARKWNGGPAGHLKGRTKKYWRKVSTRLDVEIENRNISDLIY